MMDPDACRRRLEADLLSVQQALAEADAAADTVILDQSSVGRLSRMDAMQQQAVAAGLRGRLASQKLKLQSALDRVTAGSYGLCCQCEAEIDIERLDSDPAAVFCADCSMERELHGEKLRDRR
ncbi:MAG: molecular chaperone DnaK [Burkholderiales bacterium]|jgi:DnaK suppressor protein|nr:molecular chaperone DnaK [Burkholderiales bacterium]